MPKKELNEVTYVCECGNKQTIRYWPDERILPATYCVQCRTGFNSGMSYGEMAMAQRGMLPGKPVHA
jgi:hypothetical protein